MGKFLYFWGLTAIITGFITTAWLIISIYLEPYKETVISINKHGEGLIEFIGTILSLPAVVYFIIKSLKNGTT